MRAFQKNIVVWITAGSHYLGRFDPEARFTDGSKGIRNFTLGAPEAWTADHFLVLGINFTAHAKAGDAPHESGEEDLGW